MAGQQSASEGGLGKRKTVFILITVVGCVAILWPKIIAPMFAAPPRQLPTDNYGTPGCCAFVDNSGQSANLSQNTSNLKKIENYFAYRQERPQHSKVLGVHPAMHERGRAIPDLQTVPIVEKINKNSYVYHVEGRPGPIPGLRPKNAAGNRRQRLEGGGGGATSLLLPIYTIGIIVFFVYTIVKILNKSKSKTTATVETAEKKVVFKEKVFNAKSDVLKKENNGRYTIGWTEQNTSNANLQTERNTNENDSGHPESSPENVFESIQMLEITLLKQKLQQTENKMCSIIADMTDSEIQTALQNNVSNGKCEPTSQPDDKESLSSSNKQVVDQPCEKLRNDDISDDIVKVLGLETTSTSDEYKQWSPSQNATVPDVDTSLQSIYLEGHIRQDSNILVSDAETKSDQICDDSADDNCPMVVLSSKMTLSLINDKAQ